MMRLKKLSCFFIGFFIASTSLAGTPLCQRLNTLQVDRAIGQVIIVQAQQGIHAQLNACERRAQQWRPLFRQAIPVVIGKQGIALQGQKKEGDKKTPLGLYSIEWTFGTKALALKMDYRYITAEDKFVDDPQSAQYNTWVHGVTSAKSYERMNIAPYELGAVINYNMNPTVPGAGSAIFIHLWDSPLEGTAGCIAMSKQHLLSIMHWLNKMQHPHILINA